MATCLTNDDLMSGSLSVSSYVQADGIYALEKDLICDVIGVVRQEKIQEIRDLIMGLFAPDER